MNKRERPAVQGLTGEFEFAGIGLRVLAPLRVLLFRHSVQLVADQRTSNGGAMDPDLVCTSGVRYECQLRMIQTEEQYLCDLSN